MRIITAAFLLFAPMALAQEGTPQPPTPPGLVHPPHSLPQEPTTKELQAQITILTIQRNSAEDQIVKIGSQMEMLRQALEEAKAKEKPPETPPEKPPELPTLDGAPQ